ncbi:MAG: PadR family transcriptional regulator [Allorhizobium sp.]
MRHCNHNHEHDHGHRGWHAARRGMMGEGRPDGMRGRGGGERRRMFDAGELRLVLLKLTEEQPRHGYDLIREIETLSGGAYAPSPGVIYPTMTLLLDMGLSEEQTSDGPRKLMAITEAGRLHLQEHSAEVTVAMARLQALADVSEKVEAAPVRRAMHNLKMALHGRLSQDKVERETLLEVARLIDEAAGRIERL